ncbi:MAG: L-2-amino-thiazoline-4-carboxylic acid hydrolase, partial [Gammaproteobacteria bacterium]
MIDVLQTREAGMGEASFYTEYFDRSASYHRGILEGLAEDADAVLDKARSVFEEMGPTLAYGEDREHPMADSLLSCAALLAIFRCVRDSGIDEHRFGAAVVARLKKATTAAKQRAADSGRTTDPEEAREGLDRLIEAGAASQNDAHPGQFVFDVAREDGGGGAWRMNITSCAICALYSQYDAMKLVPYMCATDDVMSEFRDQGLSRSGTIALGRTHCDFRYRPGAPTEHLSALY